MSAIQLVVVGLLGFVLGGELLVRGAVSTARSFGISPMVIGLTLVGLGTSTPELVTSLQAALSASSGIAVGNVVGPETSLGVSIAIAVTGLVLTILGARFLVAVR